MTEAPLKRSFRGVDSLEAERATRNMLSPFLRAKGFDVVEDSRESNGQTLKVRSPDGVLMLMRVRLCWNRQRKGKALGLAGTYSAVQILAKIKDGDWIGSLNAKVEREQSRGITHFLFVQDGEGNILYAALVPLSELVAIWVTQRDTCDQLIRSNRLHGRKKNWAENGGSPTVYLQDDRAPQVATILWDHRGVQDLAKYNSTSVKTSYLESDQAGGTDASYVPENGDNRLLVEQQIRARRGQQRFRDKLRARHGNCCLVTGCSALAVLEAAHIKPYQGENDNNLANGLLLRADIHTLFDLNLLGIEPSTLEIKLHPAISTHYTNMVGQILSCNEKSRPSIAALEVRYKQFQQRLASAG